MITEKSKKRTFLLVDKEDLKEEIQSFMLEAMTTLQTEKVWITAQETMALLSIKSPTTLQSLRDKGLIEFTQPLKKLILYKKSSVLAYLEKHAHKTF